MTKQLKKQFENQSQTEYMQNNQPQTMRGEEEKQNRIKTQSQSGRSMIEMLGVLAIIAILSIGGIVGYKLAMNYYQAAQIAYEMNMMRTDAKVKITQGTEELLLGDPYDSEHIHFNNYDTDFGCKYVDENDFISEETVSCRIANAYFVELPKIPNGVCQPLTRLINGMDSLIAFYVNGSEYEEGGNCQEGENDLYVIFTAETMSNLTHCEGDNDCESLENTPYCDTNRHVCVECEESNDCEEFEVCDRETGRCIADCTKGACNSGVCVGGVCKECKNMGDCNNGLACIDNQCVSCESESDCEGKHCIDGSCVDCTESTSKYNAVENKCVQCETNDDCLEKGTEKPICNENNECEPCPEGEAWNDEFEECVVTSCHTNQECNVNGKSGYYCFMRFGYACDTEFSNEDPDYIGGQCRRVKADLISEQATNIGGKNFYGSGQYMTWYSACRFCAAQTGGDESQCLNPASQPQFMGGWEDIDWQCYNDQNTPDVSMGKRGYCKAEAGESPASGSVLNKNVSSTIQKFIKMYGGEWHYLWMRNNGPDCDSWVVRLNSGQVLHRNRYYPGKVGGDNPFCRQIK